MRVRVDKLTERQAVVMQSGEILGIYKTEEETKGHAQNLVKKYYTPKKLLSCRWMSAEQVCNQLKSSSKK